MRYAASRLVVLALGGFALLPLAGCSSNASGPGGVGRASVVLVSDAPAANAVPTGHASPTGIRLTVRPVPSSALASLTIDLSRIDVHVAAAGDDEAPGTGDETSGGSESGWVTLELEAVSPINLMDLASGGLTIATGSVPAGTINQVRLFFDAASLELAEAITPNGQETVDPGTYEVRIPSAEQTGLKLNVSVEVADGSTETVMVEVGMDASVGTLVWNANGFQMSPVLRTR